MSSFLTAAVTAVFLVAARLCLFSFCSIEAIREHRTDFSFGDRFDERVECPTKGERRSELESSIASLVILYVSITFGQSDFLCVFSLQLIGNTELQAF